jgi:hypothetical protein
MQLLARPQLQAERIAEHADMACCPYILVQEVPQLAAPVLTRDAATVAALLLRVLLETAIICTWGMHLVPGLLCTSMTG